MSQKRTISGRRSALIWLSALIVLVVAAVLAVIVLFIYPNYQHQQQVEQHYQAGVAFQNVGNWEAAEAKFKQVISIDANYKDIQTRLAEVKAKQQEQIATAQAKAAQATTTAQARAEATATAATVEARIAQATSVAATATAQAKATVQAQEAKATATADALAELEAIYQKCVGAINLGRWAEAKATCDQVCTVDPNYKDVQAKLAEIETKLAGLRALTPTPMPPTYTPYPTATPYPTYTPVPTLRPTVTPWKALDETAIPATYYFGFNTSKAPFNERLVRRAFSCAIDRQAIVDDIDSQLQPATTFIPPETLGRNLYGEVGCPYDPNKARELLVQAGYPNGEGLPKIVLMYSSTYARPRKVAETVQKMWLAVLGVNVRLETMGWEAYIDLLAVDAPQIYLIGWAADYNDPINFLKDVFHSGSSHNYANFANPEYDELVEAASIETDKARRLEMFTEAERILCETEAVIAPIYHYTSKR